MNTRPEAERSLFEPVTRVSAAIANASWPKMPAHWLADICESTHDISAGASLLLKILRREAVDDAFRNDADDPASVGRPLFNEREREQLMSLAVASLDALSDRADRLIESMEAFARAQSALREGDLR